MPVKYQSWHFYPRATIEIDGRPQCPGENSDVAAPALIVTFYLSDWFLVGSYGAYENGHSEISPGFCSFSSFHVVHCNRRTRVILKNIKRFRVLMIIMRV